MKSETFFSIIIPTYNRRHLIQATVNTVLVQTFQNYELIIVDDGSVDNTEEIVVGIIKENRDNGSEILYVKQDNSERAAARNNGLKNSKGQYVLFLDSDDILYPHHLQTAYDYIKHHNNPEFIHLNYEIINSEGSIIRKAPIFDSYPNKELIKGNFLSCNGVFLKRTIALENLFNEDRVLSAMEDWELWLRLASKYDLHYINTITSAIIDHNERSVLVTNKDALINRVEALIKYIQQNNEVINYYKKDLSKFKSSCYSYIALHLALTGKYKRETVNYLIRSFRFPSSLFSRRFYAILKRLI